MSEEPAAPLFRLMKAVKHCFTKLCGITCQKIVKFLLAAVRTSYLTACSLRIHFIFHSALVTTSVLYTRVCRSSFTIFCAGDYKLVHCKIGQCMACCLCVCDVNR
jgi:hypothetical protein